MSTDRRTIKWYNNFAQEYTDHVRDENDSIYHSLYEKPAMYNLLPDLKGAKVISIGCGSGEDCNQLQKRGAKVTGIDISDGLIAIAKAPSILPTLASLYIISRIGLKHLRRLIVYSSQDLVTCSRAATQSILLCTERRALVERQKVCCDGKRTKIITRLRLPVTILIDER